MYHPTIVSHAIPKTDDYALVARDWFSQNVIKAIDNEEQSNLALSYLTGQKNLLSSAQKEKLRLVGLAHVVVASGYHLSVVINVAKKRFGKISRFATLAGALLMLIAYISITGFTASMERAGLVAALSVFAWYFGRKFHPMRLLIFVAAITLVINTSNLLNLAWQLSFASYSGIILLSPLITKFLYGERKPGYFASLIIASISAQIFCLPLTIYTFGSISGLAILANVLITPTIPLVMLLTFLTGLTSWVPFAFIAGLLTQLHLNIIDFIASIPWVSLDLGEQNVAIFLLYIPIVALVLLLKWRTGHSFRPSYAKIYTC
jgi:competence protein ComEC